MGLKKIPIKAKRKKIKLKRQKKGKKKTNCPSKKTKTTKKNKDKFLNFKNNEELKSSNRNIIKKIFQISIY